VRLLLVNPWIADFAAHNFWTRPLGLYALAEWAWERGAASVLVDCLSPFAAPGKFPRTCVEAPAPLRGFPRRYARYGIPPEEFRGRIRRAGAFDAVLVTSGMSYWYPGAQWAIREIRGLRPDVPIVLGGIYPSLWPDHAQVHSGADHVLPGPLERIGERLAEILGLPARPVREGRPWHRQGLHDGAGYAAVRTARGCPYRCGYCAAARLWEGFEARDPAEVAEELLALATLGVGDVAFYDDALLADFGERLGEVLGRVAASGAKLNFHTPNGLHAARVSQEAAASLARFATIRLSLETVDPGRQSATGGKVGNEDLRRAVGRLLRAGAPAESIGVYLMAGLPGQDLGEVREGVRFVRSLGVRPHVTELSPIPGTPIWDELAARGTIPSDLDPLLTNNTVFTRAFGGYPWAEFESLLASARAGPGPAGRATPPPLPPAPVPRT
jgi:radical SAM superfamily enzyme YgiQ (UPF0313 family)